MRRLRKKYVRERPDLTIEHMGTTNIGRCLNEDRYLVTSSTELPPASMQLLKAAGVLGYGQGFKVANEDSVMDTISLTTFDFQGRAISVDKDCTTSYRYYLYEVVRTIDSGD